MKKTILKGMRLSLMVGAAPVDEYVPNAANYHVLEDGGVLYDCMMN
jgi:hypothetical protein